MKKNRIIYLDILRIMAAFAVIVIHVSTQFWHSESINSLNWIFMNFWNAISRWAVPVFVMISGCLFFSKNKEVKIKTIFKKYILRLLFAFIIWTIIYSIFSIVIYKKDFDTVIATFISGYYHMWYLFAIAGVYMAYPLLINIIKEEQKIKYFLLIVFLLQFLISNIIKFGDILVPNLNNNTLTMVMNNIHSSFNYLIPGDVLGYSFYFVLGYYLYNNELQKKHIKFVYIGSIISFLLTIIGSIVISKTLAKPSDAFFGYFSINVLLMSCGVFLLLKNKLLNIKTINRQKTITDLSDSCFGIYLSHVLVLELLSYYLEINAKTITPVLSIPIVSLLIFIICYILTKIIKQIPIINKYIV